MTAADHTWVINQDNATSHIISKTPANKTPFLASSILFFSYLPLLFSSAGEQRRRWGRHWGPAEPRTDPAAARPRRAGAAPLHRAGVATGRAAGTRSGSQRTAGSARGFSSGDGTAAEESPAVRERSQSPPVPARGSRRARSSPAAIATAAAPPALARAAIFPREPRAAPAASASSGGSAEGARAGAVPVPDGRGSVCRNASECWHTALALLTTAKGGQWELRNTAGVNAHLHV